MSSTPPDDHDLLRAAANGDREAFTVLYRRHQAIIYRFARHMCNCDAMAEDVTQEVFIALIREPARFDERRGPLRAYLHGIARHLVLQRLERDRRLVALPDSENREKADDSITSPLVVDDDLVGRLSRSQAIESLRKTIAQLPPHYREAIVLCELQGLSYAEAAGVAECAIGTIRSRLHRGRALLLARMRASESPLPARASGSSAGCLA